MCSARYTKRKPRWGKILSKKGVQSRILLANPPERRIQHRQSMRQMSTLRKCLDETKRDDDTHIFTMAFCPVGNWYYGSIPFRKKQLKFLIMAIDYFTKWVEAKLVTMITDAQNNKLCVEKHYLQVLSPMCHNIRQWKAVCKPQVLKILQRLRS